MKLELNIEKKHLYIFTLINAVILVAIFVFAAGDPYNPGHPWQEVDFGGRIVMTEAEPDVTRFYDHVGIVDHNLEVGGNIKGNQLCIGRSCKDKWWDFEVYSFTRNGCSGKNCEAFDGNVEYYGSGDNAYADFNCPVGQVIVSGGANCRENQNDRLKESRPEENGWRVKCCSSLVTDRECNIDDIGSVSIICGK